MGEVLTGIFGQWAPTSLSQIITMERWNRVCSVTTKVAQVSAKVALGGACYLVHPEIFYLGLVVGAIWDEQFSQAGDWLSNLLSHSWHRIAIFGGITLLTATMGLTCLCFLSAAYLGSQLIPLSHHNFNRVASQVHQV